MQALSSMPKLGIKLLRSLFKASGTLAMIVVDEVIALLSAPRVCVAVKSLTRLQVSMHVINYYEMINFKRSVSLLRHDHGIKNFKLKFDVIKERKNERSLNATNQSKIRCCTLDLIIL